LVLHSSTIAMMHGPINIRYLKYNFTTWLDTLQPTTYTQLRQLSTHCLMYCCSGPVI